MLLLGDTRGLTRYYGRDSRFLCRIRIERGGNRVDGSRRIGNVSRLSRDLCPSL